MENFHKRLLIAAQGYSELGLPDLALAELAQIPADSQDEPPVIETRLSVLMVAKRFREALPVAGDLCRAIPDKAAGYIHAAFCLHELGDSRGAREMLCSGPESLKCEATYYYNLACYEAALGNLDAARTNLDVSFAMDRKLRDHALTDPDLVALRPCGSLS